MTDRLRTANIVLSWISLLPGALALGVYFLTLIPERWLYQHATAVMLAALLFCLGVGIAHGAITALDEARIQGRLERYEQRKRILRVLTLLWEIVIAAGMLFVFGLVWVMAHGSPEKGIFDLRFSLALPLLFLPGTISDLTATLLRSRILRQRRQAAEMV